MSADTFTPDVGQHIAPDGTVTYEFEGHVHAEGLDLDAWTAAGAPPADRKVRWLRESDGAVIAELYGSHDQTDDASTLTLRAQRSDGSDRAQLDLVSGDAFNPPRVGTFILGGTRTIIDGDGVSSFLQLGAGADHVALFGPFFVAVDCPAVGHSETDFALPAAVLAFPTRLPLGVLDQSAGGGFMDFVTWSYVDDALPNTFRFLFNNRSVAGAAVGDLVLHILAYG